MYVLAAKSQFATLHHDSEVDVFIIPAGATERIEVTIMQVESEAACVKLAAPEQQRKLLTVI